MKRRVIVIKDEREFNISLKALNKFSMTAYKELIFNVMPSLRAGKLVGKKIDRTHYEVQLTTGDAFQFVYGPVNLKYTVNKSNIVIEGITPTSVLEAFYKFIPPVIHGIPICDSQARFKLALYESMKGANK